MAVRTQTAGSQPQSFHFSRSGVGSKNVHIIKSPRGIDAAALGATLQEP